jgi:hypothetical protein
MRWKNQLLPAITLALAFSPIAAAQDGAVMKAMRDELERSMKKLQLENLERPYFIAYKVTESDSRGANASFGSLVNSHDNHGRSLSVEVRVGDHKLDNKHFFSYSFGGNGVVRFAGYEPLPLDDNYDELRRQLWLATDAAYKKALEDIAKKRAALENRNRTEDIPDFSQEKPAKFSESAPAVSLSRAEAENMAREYSAEFRKSPAVFESSVGVAASATLIRYVNTEGTFYSSRRIRTSIAVSASTQAVDGQTLSQGFTAHGQSMEELPSKSEVLTRIQSLSAMLGKLRSAPIAERYSGPVLFEGEAAARIFAQLFAKQLVGTPKTIVDNPQFQQYFAQDDDSLVEKIGARVLPDFLSVVDDPTAQEYANQRLQGTYSVDDEGVAAQRTLVIENGILKTVLTGRDPVSGVTSSTGNRHGGVVAPSNLILTSTRALSPVALRAELLLMAKRRGKEYAIVVRQVSGTSSSGNAAMMLNAQKQPSRISAIVAYKLRPDGTEELIRDATITGIDVSAFRDIAAVSDAATVHSSNYVSRMNPFEPNFAPAPVVTYVVPSLLFEDLSVQKSTAGFPKPPILDHPFFSR